MKKFNDSLISEKSKPLIIAEIGQSHLGSISEIKKIINKLSNTGVDIVKFQTHYADAESTYDEPFRKFISSRYKNRFDYWKDMEFNKEQWKTIKFYCEKNNLIFLSSPFSVKAAKTLKSIGLNFWKIGSGEFFSEDLINYLIKLNDTIILSTGMSTISEINDLIKILKKKKIKFILMQCTSLYPSTLSDIGINVLDKFKKKFNCFYGLSDHSGSIYPSIYALCAGSKLIEVHFKSNNSKLNPDKDSSLDLGQIKELCKARDQIHHLNKYPVNKNILSYKLKKNKKIFTKSIALNTTHNKGYMIQEKDITLKKPGFGIPIKKKKLIFGKKLNKKVSHKRLLKLTDIN